MVTSEKHQKALMGGIEALVGLDHPGELIPAVPKLLMVLYQADILDEAFIQSWGTHVSKKYVDRDTSKKVRKASEPFLKVGSLSSLLSTKHVLKMILDSGSTRRTTMRTRTRSKFDSLVL